MKNLGKIFKFALIPFSASALVVLFTAKFEEIGAAIAQSEDKTYHPADRDSQGGRFSGADPRQGGSIKIEAPQKSKNPYKEGQESAINYFKGMIPSVESLRTGGSSALPDIPDNALNHMSGIYLMCAVNLGTCPSVLEAILEVDVINSKLSGKISCNNMKRFWKRWLANSLEDRHSYLVKTGFIQEHQNFIQNVRPKFLKCEETVKQITNGVPTARFFADRYRSGSPQEKLIPKVLALLQKTKQEIPNVFAAMGAVSSE